ncbi:hypothetical protein L1987_28143 [Smallanthus sonchifolius]|uniref:Uncharacterized protein n=1 Tax=Smallanthus sonchifolius TaxID=185202 RepID=A0ACB9ICW1_9ASTR|nr:hypothetical protein L1987_28143 [Smallanthus sonchifolius]
MTANVIFIDLPVGTGFSYATTYNASRSSDSLLAQQSYKFLIKWLEEHPRFINNPLYITGISYMGLLAPIVTLEIFKENNKIFKGNERGDIAPLNIKGCVIVSPLTDKFSDFNSRFEFAHRFALISDDIYESAKETCRGNYVDNDPENVLCLKSLERVDECTSRINSGNILDPYFDEEDPDPNCREAKALHVREGTIEKFEKTNDEIHYAFKKADTEHYSYDIFSSIAYHKTLISKNCQVLIFSGDHDFTFPYVGAEQWITSLNLPVESPWNPWFVNNQVAGYVTKYVKDEYSLTYTTIKVL